MTDSLRCPDGHITESSDYCDVCGLPMTLSVSPPEGAGESQALPSTAQGSAPSQPDKTCPNCHAMVPAADLFCENCGYDFTTGQLPMEPAALAAPGALLPGSVSSPSSPQPAARPGNAPVPATAPNPVIGPSSAPAAAPPAPAGTSPGAFGPAGPTIQPPPAHPAPGPATPGPIPPLQSGPLAWVAELWVDPDWFATQESEEACPSSGIPGIIPLWERSLLIGRVSASRNIHPQIDCGSDHGVSRRHAQLSTDGQRWWIEDLQSSNGTFVGVAGAPLPTLPIPAGQRTEFTPGDRIYVGAWTRIVVRKATADEA